MRVLSSIPALLLGAAALLVGTLWFITADVNSEDARDYGADSGLYGAPEAENCGAAYDAALIAKGTTRGGDPFSNHRAIDAQCVNNAKERLAAGGATGAASLVCLAGAAATAIRRPRVRAVAGGAAP